LSLVIGLAVIAALKKIGITQAGLKWPNDVLLLDKKLAGILIELSGDPADSCTAIIGIGLNVNMRNAENIDQPWISLCEALDKPIDRNFLVSTLLSELSDHLKLHRAKGFAELKDSWESCHLWQGKDVTLSTGAIQIQGRVLGIGLDGALRLDVSGCEKSFNGGELSLRLRNDP
jgi:BirA family biotin operon repressor/biotin-[acetyl-CoA-carboxylase] ligase